MQNLMTLWATLSLARRAVIVGATLAMFLAVLGLARLAGQTNMALLYSGLDPAAAGQVVAALDQQGVQSEIRGDSIYVDQALRDTLRDKATLGVAQNRPRLTPLTANLASEDATAKSHCATSWQPAAVAIPCTLAITGTCNF